MAYFLEIVAELDARFMVHWGKLDDDIQSFAFLAGRGGPEIVGQECPHSKGDLWMRDIYSVDEEGGMRHQLTFGKAQLITLLLDFQTFVDVQRIRVDERLRVMGHSNCVAHLFYAGAENERIAWILAQAAPTMGAFWICYQVLLQGALGIKMQTCQERYLDKGGRGEGVC